MNVLKCPSCHISEGVRQVHGQCAVCRKCSKSKRRVFQFCYACQREWAHDASNTDSCLLPDCALRAALLSTKLIDDPHSTAKGCPFFRACPKCKALLTHNGIGCPNIVCPDCKTRFCFRCLSQQCSGIDELIFLRLSHISRIRFRLLPFEEYPINVCRVVSNTEALAGLGL